MISSSEFFIQGGIMIFISSYLEYVRVRNFLKSQSASFCLLHEWESVLCILWRVSLCGHKCADGIYVSLLLRYAGQSDISRARVQFFEGKRKIMLYTERSHFYHRYKVGSLECFVHWSCICVLFYIGDTTLLSIVA